MQSAAGGAAGGREERSRGVRRQPAPRSKSARTSARPRTARAASTRAAARPRVSSTRSTGSGAVGAARARGRDAVSRGRGGWRARGTFARRTAIADAALEGARERGRGYVRRARRRRARRRGRAFRRLALRARARWARRGLEVEMQSAAGGAAGGREERLRGVRRQPTPRSKSASASPQARGRAGDDDEIGGAAATHDLLFGVRREGRHGRRLECEVRPATWSGSWARGALARRAAVADAARGARGSIGAAEDSALDVGTCGGEAARFAGPLVGSGRGGRHGARGRKRPPWRRHAVAGSARSTCGGVRRRARRWRGRQRGREAERATATRSTAKP